MKKLFRLIKFLWSLEIKDGVLYIPTGVSSAALFDRGEIVKKDK